MTPILSPHSDDEQKAIAVLEDLLKVMCYLRVGLFARDPGRLCIAISEPRGNRPFAAGMTHSKQEIPSQRSLVSVWVDDCASEYLPTPTKVARRADVFDGIRQVLDHFGSLLIPAPVGGNPTMLLCDRLPSGQFRAYAVVGELDCYGFTWRPVKSPVVQ